MLIIFYFQEENSAHCETTQCLTEYAFNELDMDKDGNLTWAEYAVVNMEILGMLAPELCQQQNKQKFLLDSRSIWMI